MILNVGLTGGIATGKSTVAGMLQEKGATLIDFDELTRQAEEPGQPAWQKIVDYFGPAILRDDRTIDRKRLGAIVFQDRDKLAKLNELVHPILFGQRDRIMASLVIHHPDAIVISDIPLLFELGLQKSFELVVLVYASPAQQIERLMRRTGWSYGEVWQRIASQMPIDEKRARADIIIDNSGSLEETRNQVHDCWCKLIARRDQHL